MVNFPRRSLGGRTRALSASAHFHAHEILARSRKACFGSTRARIRLVHSAVPSKACDGHPYQRTLSRIEEGSAGMRGGILVLALCSVACSGSDGSPSAAAEPPGIAAETLTEFDTAVGPLREALDVPGVA